MVALNELPADEAERRLSACCASPEWVRTVLSRRPYASLDELVGYSDKVIAGLSWPEIERALAAHPRIGERATGGMEAKWSREEQSAAATDDATELVEANAAYEKRFDRVFLICATGLSASQILAALRARLANDDATEAAVTREELTKIVRLRLARIA
ncbi:2-oxo-4-hydroxy-4-carboxy-5-ureidoimidazoline decarboxylase [Fodinicola acaciae]|uniref:2-oxo-4-hydroxy-4-carboxy-5-ureidoimidazoline decarboxylase n=1 Tax=Fodinicola acaciae TaxID=2681555 RepID=UPI0013D5063D|nr:2-oxo-4-hydroxy-4-carboxy-5-ureidoimidazoline decarboxylase [Fodinicola acaciae]